MAANQLQRKHLQERISKATRARSNLAAERAEENAPANIKRAKAQIARLEKIVREWDRKSYERVRARQREIEAEGRRANEAVLFKDPEVALRAVQKFEDA